MNNTKDLSTKKVIIEVLKGNGFKIIFAPNAWFTCDKVECKGIKGGIFYINMPKELKHLPNFLNIHSGTK